MGLPKHYRGWRGYHGLGNVPWTQVVVQKLCCHKDRKILQKNCTANCKKSGTFIKGEGGRVVGVGYVH